MLERERVRVSVAFNLSHLQLALSWQAPPLLFLLLSFLHGVLGRQRVRRRSRSLSRPFFPPTPAAAAAAAARGL